MGRLMAHAVERRCGCAGGSDPDPPLRLGGPEVAYGIAIHGGAAAAMYSCTLRLAPQERARTRRQPAQWGCLRGCLTMPGHRGCPAMLALSSCPTVPTIRPTTRKERVGSQWACAGKQPKSPCNQSINQSINQLLCSFSFSLGGLSWRSFSHDKVTTTCMLHAHS